MTTLSYRADRQRSRLAAVRDTVGVVVGAVLGLAPHVLHHVGLIAGTAFVAGAGATRCSMPSASCSRCPCSCASTAGSAPGWRRSLPRSLSRACSSSPRSWSDRPSPRMTASGMDRLARQPRPSSTPNTTPNTFSKPSPQPCGSLPGRHTMERSRRRQHQAPACEDHPRAHRPDHRRACRGHRRRTAASGCRLWRHRCAGGPARSRRPRPTSPAAATATARIVQEISHVPASLRGPLAMSTPDSGQVPSGRHDAPTPSLRPQNDPGPSGHQGHGWGHGR